MTNLVSHETIPQQAYKILDVGHTGGFSKYIYTVPGEWTPFIDDLVRCRRGYHVLIGKAAVLDWLDRYGDNYRDGKIYLVDTLDLVKSGDKWIAKSVRLIDDPKPYRLSQSDCLYIPTQKLKSWLEEMDQN